MSTMPTTRVIEDSCIKCEVRAMSDKLNYQDGDPYCNVCAPHACADCGKKDDIYSVSETIYRCLPCRDGSQVNEGDKGDDDSVDWKKKSTQRKSKPKPKPDAARPLKKTITPKAITPEAITPETKKQAKKQDAEWTCETCTFINQSKHSQCTMCDSSPATAGWLKSDAELDMMNATEPRLFARVFPKLFQDS
jgi:hypothetical protein